MVGHPAEGDQRPTRCKCASRSAALPTGNRLTVRDIEGLLERAVNRTRTADPAHARAVVPHGLRHTASTLMLAEGWDVKVVAQLLGHASVSTTSKYLDELPGELSVALNAHPFTPYQNK
jgi:site-specific recombinase XerD